MNSMCFSPSWDEPKRWRKKRASWWIVFLVALIVLAVALTVMLCPAAATFLGPLVMSHMGVILGTAVVAGGTALVSGVVIAVEYANGTDSKADKLDEAEKSVSNSSELSEDEKQSIIDALNNTIKGSVDDPLSIVPKTLNPVEAVKDGLSSVSKLLFGGAALLCACVGGVILYKSNKKEG